MPKARKNVVEKETEEEFDGLFDDGEDEGDDLDDLLNDLDDLDVEGLLDDQVTDAALSEASKQVAKGKKKSVNLEAPSEEVSEAGLLILSKEVRDGFLTLKLEGEKISGLLEEAKKHLADIHLEVAKAIHKPVGWGAKNAPAAPAPVDDSDDAEDEEEAAKPAPRKRGRPRKVVENPLSEEVTKKILHVLKQNGKAVDAEKFAAFVGKKISEKPENILAALKSKGLVDSEGMATPA